MNDDRWRGIRMAIVTVLVAVSLGIMLGVRWGALGAFHYCGAVAAGGRW